MDFDEQQQAAIDDCVDVKKRIVSVSGAAGTGKTSILRRIHELLTNAGYRVALCAPTGKAAKRIQEASGINAMTIHRLLEYTYPGERDEETGKVHGISEPRRHNRNPLEYDIVLADEYAMVPHELHRNLIGALPAGGCVRAFGDMNQLRPIESNKQLAKKPSPFQELVAHKDFASHVLQTNYRQSEGSGIITNAERIKSGKAPQRLDDCWITQTDQPVEKLEEIVFKALDKGVDFSKVNNQIITPMNKTWVGQIALNKMLQKLFVTGQEDWYELPRHSWHKDKWLNVRIGDKVIYTVNAYDLRQEDERWEEDGVYADGNPRRRKLECPKESMIFNGETGYVTEVNEFGEISIDVGDRTVLIPPEVNYWNADRGIMMNYDPRKDIDLAYAITTHKSQGSEYDEVVYILNKSTLFGQNRANFYTAVTRARNRCIIVTDGKSLSNSLWRVEK